MGELWGYLAAAAVACGGLGGWVASVKSRPIGEGVILGLAFGPLGVIVEGLLPVGVTKGQERIPPGEKFPPARRPSPAIPPPTEPTDRSIR